jgi:hypothetical protein
MVAPALIHYGQCGVMQHAPKGIIAAFSHFIAIFAIQPTFPPAILSLKLFIYENTD